MNRLLKWIYIVLGVASIAYYFVLWHASRLGLSMSGMWPVLGVVLILCGVLCGDDKVPGWVRIGWRATLCVLLAALLILEGMVVSGMAASAPPELDYVIVLGARVDPDGPSPALVRRLNATMACLEGHPRVTIIATGGQGRDEPMSEARCIREELIRRGVKPEQIRMEERSTSTMENIQNAMPLMHDSAARVGIITNNYHVFRATRIAQKAGLVNVFGIAAEYTGHTKFHYMIREAICIVVDFLRGNL